MLAKHDVGAVHDDGKLCRGGSVGVLEVFAVVVGFDDGDDDDILASFLR